MFHIFEEIELLEMVEKIKKISTGFHTGYFFNIFSAGWKKMYFFRRFHGKTVFFILLYSSSLFRPVEVVRFALKVCLFIINLVEARFICLSALWQVICCLYCVFTIHMLSFKVNLFFLSVMCALSPLIRRKKYKVKRNQQRISTEQKEEKKKATSTSALYVCGGLQVPRRSRRRFIKNQFVFIDFDY